MQKLLLSNDDGVHAPGLQCLKQFCEQAGYQVNVIAPDRDRSGASNSLTLDRPLHPVHLASGDISINGTPADCVHLGIHVLCEPGIERVISGINSGANLGDDVLYSGTVAAAMEGRFLNTLPVAISLAGKQHFETAAKVLIRLLPQIENLSFQRGTLLNINVPDVPYEELNGLAITRLGHRHPSVMPEKTLNPRGKECFWISVAGEGDDAGEGTDFYAIAHKTVSVTPLQIDMTAPVKIELSL